MPEKLSIQVKPGSRKGPLVLPGAGGELLVYVREPAADGRANKAVIELLADHFGVPKSRVEIVRGQSSRHKTVQINR